MKSDDTQRQRCLDTPLILLILACGAVWTAVACELREIECPASPVTFARAEGAR
jgi:hypothetical protein